MYIVVRPLYWDPEVDCTKRVFLISFFFLNVAKKKPSTNTITKASLREKIRLGPFKIEREELYWEQPKYLDLVYLYGAAGIIGVKRVTVV